MFHLLGYNVVNGVNDANVDMVAVVDPTFTRRGGASGVGHYILTERYNLLAAMGWGADLTAVRANVPTWNAWFRHQVWPVTNVAALPTPFWLADYRDYPIGVPQNDELAWEESVVSGAGGDSTDLFLWITPSGSGWDRNLPTGIARQTARFSSTITSAVGAWSADGSITFAENLKGGVYAVLGVYCQVANVRAFNVNFVRAQMFQGRKLFPGDIVVPNVGSIPNQKGPNWLGVWGKFHTFEPPQMRIYGLTAGAKTVNGRMDLLYLGESEALLG